MWRFERDNSLQEKYNTSMNISKGPPSLEDAQKPDSLISMASKNTGSEYNNKIVTETDEFNDRSVKPYSHSDILYILRILFIFGNEYFY